MATNKADVSVAIPSPPANLPSPLQGGSPAPEADAPEKQLTLFAFQVATLEKASNAIGTLAFIWATVVLLGGFAITLTHTDYLVVTFILVVEGARVFSVSHELEWQHQALTTSDSTLSRSLRFLNRSMRWTPAGERPEVTTPSLRKREISRGSSNLHSASDRCDLRTPATAGRTRTWQKDAVPIIPLGGPLRESKSVSAVLYWVQPVLALASVGLSLWRVVKHDFTPEDDEVPAETQSNRKFGLLLFFCLALAEALLFLLERAYWVVTVTIRKFFDRVNEDCGFSGDDGVVIVKRFYYDAFSRCITGSVFDGLKMDMVTYGEGLIVSDDYVEQLMGIRILRTFAEQSCFEDDTLRKIETTSDTLERLVEMVGWTNTSETELRRSAGEVVEKLVGRKQNLVRVAGIPGAMASLSGLLRTGRRYGEKVHELSMRPEALEEESYEYSALGLRILRRLAEDNDNCEKIGADRGLLAKIIDLTYLPESHEVPASGGEKAQVLELALEVVKMLVWARGPIGEVLRKRVSENVYTAGYLRRILRLPAGADKMQRLALDIVAHLSVEDEAREMLGRTGGMAEAMVRILVDERRAANLREAAGDALAMVVVESEGNCEEVLRTGVVGKVAATLEMAAAEEGLLQEKFRVACGRLLRNLCAYGGTNCAAQLKSEAASVLPKVMKRVPKEKRKPLEVTIGLTAQILKLLTHEEATQALEETTVEDTRVVVQSLIQVLQHYSSTTMQDLVETPRMRRYAVELMIEMMKRDREHIHAFRKKGGEELLKTVLNSTSALENFKAFTGSVGLCYYRRTIHDLVTEAKSLLSSA